MCYQMRKRVFYVVTIWFIYGESDREQWTPVSVLISYSIDTLDLSSTKRSRENMNIEK